MNHKCNTCTRKLENCVCIEHYNPPCMYSNKSYTILHGVRYSWKRSWEKTLANWQNKHFERKTFAIGNLGCWALYTT